ncbi:MAG: glycosyltransferase family 4 protein [archaeon]
MKKLRLGFIVPYYHPNLIGGSEISVKLLAEKLVKKGIFVTVFSFDGEKYSEENIKNVRVIRHKVLTKKAMSLSLISPVYRTIKEWEDKIDIFHVYNVFPLAGAGFYKLMGGKKKIISTLNNFGMLCPLSSLEKGCKKCNFLKRSKCLYDESKGFYEKLMVLPYSLLFPISTNLSKKIDIYIALSGSVKKTYEKFNFDKNKIIIIPNFFVPFDHKSKKNKQKKDEISILYCGRIEKTKGVDLLIKAFSEIIQKSNKKIKLIIVGGGRELENCIKLAKELKAYNSINFVGKVAHENLPKYYSNADIFVHPGRGPESFSRSLNEALSFNIPCVVSDIGSSSEVIKDAGLVFRTGSIDDLKLKIKILIENKNLRRRLSKNCEKVSDFYKIDKVINKIIKLYIKS